MAKKKVVKKKTASNTLSFDNVEVYTYEAFCVAELLMAKDNVSIKGMADVNGFAYPPDLYAPNGVPSLELTGPTVIEAKKTLSYATVKEMASMYETHGANYNIVVVYFESTISKIPEESVERGKKIIYISFEKLNSTRRAIKKPQIYYAEKAKKDWKQEREDIIRKAREFVAQDNNVLFLGAGVSMSANMPSWKDLLKGLMGEVKQLKDPTLDAFKELSSHVLEECGDSNLIMGRYLQTAISLYDNKSVFSELIQKYLYNDNNTSPLLMNLARIVQHKKVNEVITYNFDDLLEQNLENLGLRDSVDYTSISKDAEIKGHNTLPIYHVHGIIPKEGPVDTVVFSEEEYHKRYSTAYHWSNVEQLHALTRMHCFFVGLSMTDPNLRRLLDAAKVMNKSNNINHFAFLQRKNLENYCVSDVNKTCKYVHVSGSLIDKEKQKEIYDLNYAVIDSIFNELGVNVIWYEDHTKELPELVAKVFGVSQYEGMDKQELIALCEKRIDSIKKQEKKIFNPDLTDKDPVKIYMMMRYAREVANAYWMNVSEIHDMLRVLTDGIERDGMSKAKFDEVQNCDHGFSDNMTGYGDLFTVWLRILKSFYE